MTKFARDCESCDGVVHSDLDDHPSKLNFGQRLRCDGQEDGKVVQRAVNLEEPCGAKNSTLLRALLGEGTPGFQGDIIYASQPPPPFLAKGIFHRRGWGCIF